MLIRKAELKDLKAITEIYNDAILNTAATFDTQIKTVEEQKPWFDHHDDSFPVFVAEIDQQVVGWGSLSRWSDRCAYAQTAENSVYIHPIFKGKGIGKALLKKLIQSAKETDLHTIIARISEGNDISIHLHETLGFKHIGVMKEVGKKFGRLLDVHMMQILF